MELPVINIGKLTAERKQAGIVEKLAKACRENGFFYISGHGVSVDLQNELEALSKEFFELPLEEKMQISMQKGGKAWRGYFKLGEELTSGKPDQKEGIYFGSNLDNKHPKVIEETYLHGANLYPEKPKRFQEIIDSYFQEMEKLGHLVMRGIALSLGLAENYFETKYTKDPFLLFRIFHYPPDQSESWGVGEHTDYGLLTILKQDENGGLQIKSKGEWIDAPPVENTFVCNIGDMLDKMTGGLYKSTPHRVKNTSDKSRLSFPFFFDPSFDAKVERIENLNPAQTDFEQRWDQADLQSFGGTYGEYLLGKVSKVFPELKSGLD